MSMFDMLISFTAAAALIVFVLWCVRVILQTLLG